MAQLIGLTPNATRLHSEYLRSLLLSGHSPTLHLSYPSCQVTLTGKKTQALGSRGSLGSSQGFLYTAPSLLMILLGRTTPPFFPARIFPKSY